MPFLGVHSPNEEGKTPESDEKDNSGNKSEDEQVVLPEPNQETKKKGQGLANSAETRSYSWPQLGYKLAPTQLQATIKKIELFG